MHSCQRGPERRSTAATVAKTDELHGEVHRVAKGEEKMSQNLKSGERVRGVKAENEREVCVRDVRVRLGDGACCGPVRTVNVLGMRVSLLVFLDKSV